MTARAYNLAIETSSRHGSITLGRGDEVLASAALVAERRHSVGLLPGVAAMCAEQGIAAGDLSEVYVSHGPGSFTGLRVAMAAVKMLALTQGVRIVPVPTVRVLADNVPAEAAHLLVCVNQKRDTVYAGAFERRGEAWEGVGEPGVRRYAELLREAARPLLVLGDPLPELQADEAAWLDGVTILPAALALPRSEAVYRHGRVLAAGGYHADTMTLEPLYAREPEAVTLWNQRQQQTTSNTPETKQRP